MLLLGFSHRHISAHTQTEFIFQACCVLTEFAAEIYVGFDLAETESIFHILGGSGVRSGSLARFGLYFGFEILAEADVQWSVD